VTRQRILCVHRNIRTYLGGVLERESRPRFNRLRMTQAAHNGERRCGALMRTVAMAER
jgi:hypothetical protein